MCDSRVGKDVAHFLMACGVLKEIGRLFGRCVCAELWGAESGWMNFGEWTRRER